MNKFEIQKSSRDYHSIIERKRRKILWKFRINLNRKKLMMKIIRVYLYSTKILICNFVLLSVGLLSDVFSPEIIPPMPSKNFNWKFLLSRETAASSF